MIPAHPVESVGELLHWRIAALWSSRHGRAGDSSLADTEIKSTLVYKLAGIDFREEQNTSTSQSEAGFIDSVLRQGPTPCGCV